MPQSLAWSSAKFSRSCRTAILFDFGLRNIIFLILPPIVVANRVLSIASGLIRFLFEEFLKNKEKQS